MEHAQRDYLKDSSWRIASASLNPYFNGTCSKRYMTSIIQGRELSVLILILMEHAQRAKSKESYITEYKES